MIIRSSIIFILIFQFSHLLWGQCVSGASYLDTVQFIEESQEANPEKILNLEQLKSRYQKCASQPDSVYARIMHRLGDLYRQEGDFNRAIQFTREAVAVNSSQGRGERKYLVHSYYNLGLYYRLLYLFIQSHQYFDSCIYWATVYPEKSFISLKAFEQKSFLYYQSGDYSKSIETSNSGIILAKSLQDTLLQSALMAQKAQSELAMNDIENAGHDMEAALSILKNYHTDPLYLASNYSIYASLLGEKKDRDGAIRYYHKALEVYRKQKDWAQCSSILLDLGYLYDKDLNDPVQALVCYRMGISYISKIHDPYQLAGLYNNIGIVYWRRKNYEKALNYYQKGLNVLPIQFRETKWNSNPSNEKLKLVANDYFVSTLLSNKGESLFLLYRQTNDSRFLKQALSAYEAADESVDAMRWKQFREESKLYWRSKTKQMYANAIEVCYKLQDLDKAFYFFEKSRAVLLNDRLSELGARKFLPQEEQIKVQDLQVRFLSLQQQLITEAGENKQYIRTYKQLAEAQTEWETKIRSLEFRYPVYFQYKYDQSVPELGSVRQYLRQNQQSLVEYFINDSIVYVLELALGKERLVKTVLKDLAGNATAFLSVCSDLSKLNQQYAQYTMLAGRLYKDLWEPLHLPAGRVVISTDEYFIPFEALLQDQNNSSSYLLKDYAISYAYSARFLLKRAPDQGSNEPSFLGVAPVSYQATMHLPGLAGSEESLLAIRNHFNTGLLLTEKNATRQELLKHLPFSGIVQLYSHAVANDSGKEPLLYLSDSTLSLSEISRLSSLHTEMVVLSACNTGVGLNARGEGVFSLARGFAATGVPCTVTTQWQIDNQATYQLTELFFQYISQGLARDVALQKAKLRFMNQNDKTYRLPYYWASTIIIGKTDPFIMRSIVQTSTSFHEIGLLSILIVIGLGAAGFLFRRILRKRI